MNSQMPTRKAWRERRTWVALGRYGVGVLVWLILALGLALAGSEFLDDNGDTRAGVPEFVPFIFILPALLALLVGTLSGLRLLQMLWTVFRQVWVLSDAEFDVLDSGPNGQPVIDLAQEGKQWRLTPSALVWRWRYLEDEPRLLVAAPPGRSGIVATPDLKHLFWAGRSPFTAILAWMSDRRRYGARANDRRLLLTRAKLLGAILVAIFAVVMIVMTLGFAFAPVEQTTGIVTGVKDDECTVEYRDNSGKRWTYINPGHKSGCSDEVGDPVTIYYDADDPGSADTMGNLEWGLHTLLWLGFAAWSGGWATQQLRAGAWNGARPPRHRSDS